MMNYMTKIKVDQPKCHICLQKARIWHLKKWWCHNDMELKGYCPHDKKRQNTKDSD
jgi:hypothetical protein